MNAKVLISVGLLIICTQVFSQKKTSIGNSGQGWGVNSNWSPGAIPQNGDSVIIPAGATITVKTNIYNNSPVLKIVVYGTLDFAPGGKLVLGAGSTITIMPSAKITSTGNSSEIISINGVIKYNAGSTTTVSGPAYADQYTGSSPNGFNTIVLPVHFTDFSLLSHQSTIELKWSIATDENLKSFIIQTSNDLVNWKNDVTLLVTTSIGTAINVYSYTYTQPLQTVTYYRIKALTINETAYFTEIKSIKPTVAQASPVSIYPNPAGDFIKILSTHAQADQNGILTIRSLTGSILLQKQLWLTGSFSEINISSIAAGTYILQFICKDEKYTQLLVKR
jgi:hypothetical protein